MMDIIDVIMDFMKKLLDFLDISNNSCIFARK